MAECSPQTLLDEASCFVCLSSEEREIAKLQLLCELKAIVAAASVGVGLPTGLSFVIDGGGSVIETGTKGTARAPFAFQITGARIYAETTGSIVVDIRKVTHAAYGPPVAPTGADSICAAAKPTIAAGTKSQDTTLTGWTTAVAAGDIFEFFVDSAATITLATIALDGIRT
jgi:hypothetical protein